MELTAYEHYLSNWTFFIDNFVCFAFIVFHIRRSLGHNSTFIRKSYSFSRESYAFIRESAAFIRERYAFIRELFAFIRDKNIFFYLKMSSMGFRNNGHASMLPL